MHQAAKARVVSRRLQYGILSRVILAVSAGIIAVSALSVRTETTRSISYERQLPQLQEDATGRATEALPEFDGMLSDAADAFTQAFFVASRNGTELHVNSAHRSAEGQASLYRDAIEKYGSAAAARQWVLPPRESAHVAGNAVDVAVPGAMWLEKNGVSFGICRRYVNEPWHFEFDSSWAVNGCPQLAPHA